jgi:hypothetical protein
MGTQTKTFQHRILDQARPDNYAGLYWFIEMRLGATRYVSACWPGRFVPVVPVAPDPEITRHWAHMLGELFQASGELPSIHFEPALTSVEALRDTGCYWYEFGDPVFADVVCRGCGCVEQIDAELLAASPAWMCGRCAT